jgi:antitoxin FitA
MPTLQIRDLPEDVYQSIAAAARAEHRSLSQQAVVELRRALGLVGPSRRSGLIDQLRQSKRRLPKKAAIPELLIRADRDSR